MGGSRCNLDGQSCRHGPLPTVVYICADDESTHDGQAQHCSSFARNRAWNVVDVVAENGEGVSVDQRPGWTDVMSKCSDGRSVIVVVPHPAALGMNVEDFQTLQSVFREKEKVLVAVSGLPTHSAPARRR
ncbi:recombinase family protein [Streptomyces sp. NPDC086787]|uniref:recombinase family protein n=1 Tax=Streptomyces sp. NPDC086787 TaxID=3365759 RepID=UPI003829DBB8